MSIIYSLSILEVFNERSTPNNSENLWNVGNPILFSTSASYTVSILLESFETNASLATINLLIGLSYGRTRISGEIDYSKPIV